MATQWTRSSMLALRHRLRRLRAAMMLAMLGVTCTVLPAGSAHASGLPFATGRPQTWQFSSDFEGTYDSLGQNLEWNHDSRAFDLHGNHQYHAHQRTPGAGMALRVSTLVTYHTTTKTLKIRRQT
jgi:hypothetical protein